MRLNRAFSLIEVLVVVAVLAVLAAFILPRYLGAGGAAGAHKPATVIAAANDVVCRNNLSQVRSAIAVQKATDEKGNPAGLNTLGLGPAMTRCPVGNEPYTYDSSTGQVHCPHPGHEQF